MRVKCVLCGKICRLDDQTPLAKRLKNRPIHTFMCEDCYKRISVRTRERLASGKFKLHLSAGVKGVKGGKTDSQ